MHRKYLFRYFLPIFLACVTLAPIIANPVNTNWAPKIIPSFPNSHSLGALNTQQVMPTIYILYDGSNKYIQWSAKRIYLHTRTVVPNTFLVEIFSKDMLKRNLRESQGDFIVYFFNTTLDSVILGYDTISLKEFAKLLEKYPDTIHILGIGNTEQLESYLTNPENVYFDVLEYVDIRVLEIGVLWNLATALEESETFSLLGSELRKVVSKIYCESLRELIAGVIEPSVTIGMENITRKREEYLKTLASIPKTLRKVRPLSSSERAAIDLSLIHI